MKKIIAYIITAVFAVTIQSSVYAEGNSDSIVVIPWDSGIENSFSDYQPTETSEITESEEINDPFAFEDDISDPFINAETTTEEPQISFENEPSTAETSTEADSLTESETPTEAETSETTEAPSTTAAATEPPVTAAPETEAPITTEPPVESDANSISDSNNETTTSPQMIPPDNGTNRVGGEPVEGDPDGFVATILLISGALLAFVLIMVVPPIYRKIKKSIIYKYD